MQIIKYLENMCQGNNIRKTMARTVNQRQKQQVQCDIAPVMEVARRFVIQSTIHIFLSTLILLGRIDVRKNSPWKE